MRLCLWIATVSANPARPVFSSEGMDLNKSQLLAASLGMQASRIMNAAAAIHPTPLPIKTALALDEVSGMVNLCFKCGK